MAKKEQEDKLAAQRDRHPQLETVLDAFRTTNPATGKPFQGQDTFRAIDVYHLIDHIQNNTPLPESTQKRLDARPEDMQAQMRAAAATLFEGFKQSDAKRSRKGKEDLSSMERLKGDMQAICNFDNANPHHRTRQDIDTFIREQGKFRDALEEISPAPTTAPPATFREPGEPESPQQPAAPQENGGHTPPPTPIPEALFLAPAGAAAGAAAATHAKGSGEPPRKPDPNPTFLEPGEDPSKPLASPQEAHEYTRPPVPEATFIAPGDAPPISQSPTSRRGEGKPVQRPVPETEDSPSSEQTATDAGDQKKFSARHAGIAAGTATGLAAAATAATNWKDRVRKPESRTKALVFASVAAVSAVAVGALLLHRGGGMSR